MAYDKSNIFARILRGEIPCKKVHEDAHTLAFHGGREDLPVAWFAPLGFWCARKRLEDRHRHAFGVEVPTKGEPLSIAVEINAC